MSGDWWRCSQNTDLDDMRSDDGSTAMELIDIVKKYLIDNGYAGLCHPYTECGCGIDDLMPCGEPGIDCKAAHKRKDPTGEYDELYFPGKKDVSDEGYSR